MSPNEMTLEALAALYADAAALTGTDDGDAEGLAFFAVILGVAEEKTE